MPEGEMAIEIRPATLDDEEDAIRLLEQLFEPPARVPPEYTRARSAKAFRWAVKQSNADVLLALMVIGVWV